MLFRPFAGRTAAPRGLTIIEMIVVIMIVALLMGAAFGLLRTIGRGSELPAVAAQVRGILQAARADAVRTMVRTEVGIEVNALGGRIYTLSRDTRAYFHFEEAAAAVVDDWADPDNPAEIETVYGADAQGATISAVLDEARVGEPGVIGGAVRFGGREGSMMIIDDPNGRLHHRTGIAISFDLYRLPTTADIQPLQQQAEIDPREISEDGARLVHREGIYTIGINRDGRLVVLANFEGEMSFPPRAFEEEPAPDTDGKTVVYVMDPIPLMRWTAVDVTIGPRGIDLIIDGVRRIVVRENDSEEDLRERAAERRAAVARSTAESGGLFVPLPETLDRNGTAWVVFGGDGRLDRSRHSRPFELRLARPDPNVGLGPTAIGTPRRRVRTPNFALPEASGPIQVGEGLSGRIDNLAIYALVRANEVALPDGIMLDGTGMIERVLEAEPLIVELSGAIE
jgi:prepilin-type N-terminal cleavage/methylation domain-containing protein